MKTIGIVLNPRKKQVIPLLETCDDWAERYKDKISFLLCTYDSPYIQKQYNHFSVVNEATLLKRSDLIVTLGGDGTILRTVQAVGKKEIPILGVNLGGLGFLAETSPEQLIPHMEAYLQANYFIEARSLFACHVPGKEDNYFAFNDFVIDKAGFSRVIEIMTYVNGNLLNSYVADALILSTPSGSTGYSLSAGGPIVIPETNVFLINPICPHSLTNRPVVVPNTSKITLKVYTEHKEVSLIRDGQLVKNYPSGTTLELYKADFKVRLVKVKPHSFFETLRNKLHWGEDFRDKNRWTYHNFK